MGNAPFAGQAIRIERLLIHHDERSTATSIARRGGNAPAGVIEQAKVLQFDLLNIDLNQIKVVSGLARIGIFKTNTSNVVLFCPSVTSKVNLVCVSTRLDLSRNGAAWFNIPKFGSSN
jgi:hypothetical protein